MQWVVDIPPPSARRYEGSGVVVIGYSSGWGPGHIERVPVPVGEKQLVFDVPDGYEYIGETSVTDGNVFDVAIGYGNTSGSRKEKASLVPRRVTKESER